VNWEGVFTVGGMGTGANISTKYSERGKRKKVTKSGGEKKDNFS